VVGKGGASNKGGSAGNTTNTGGTTNEGGAAGSTNEGGAAGSTAQGGAAGGGTCDPQTQVQSTECNDCFGSACGTELKACQDDTNCMAILTCFGECQDNACYTKCATDTPDGQLLLFTWLGCTDATCHDECYCPGCALATANDTCNTCFHDKCANECSGCDKNNECMAMLDCTSWLDCGSDQACQQGCQQKFPGGVTALQGLDTCMGAQCATDCQ